MTAPEGFAALILTHRRADRVFTYETLRECGYTGPIYLVVDTSDPEIGEYQAQYGDQVIVFDKADVAGTFDIGDNEPDMNGVVYARNACPGIAEELGLTHYLVLDDDYTYFAHRWVDTRPDGSEWLAWAYTRELDHVIKMFLEFLDTSGAATIAFAQAGDFIGGADGAIRRGYSRKVMNSFFVRTDRPVGFLGRINEDTTTYVVHGNRGELFFTLTSFSLNQMTTQSNPGGLTGMYLHSGTYVKSFYTVMMAPSCTSVAMMGESHRRMHHRVMWRNAVPQILPARYRRD